MLKGNVCLKIRRFEKKDKSDFIEMCTDFYTGGAALEAISAEQMSNTFEYIVGGGNSLNGLIIEHDGKIAGYGLVILYYSNEVGGLCALLDEIYVSPEFRGCGLGTQYIENVKDVFDEDIKGLRLEACYDNAGALKLYESMGFMHLNYKQLVKSAFKN